MVYELLTPYTCIVTRVVKSLPEEDEGSQPRRSLPPQALLSSREEQAGGAAQGKMTLEIVREHTRSLTRPIVLPPAGHGGSRLKEERNLAPRFSQHIAEAGRPDSCPRDPQTRKERAAGGPEWGAGSRRICLSQRYRAELLRSTSPRRAFQRIATMALQTEAHANRLPLLRIPVIRRCQRVHLPKVGRGLM